MELLDRYLQAVKFWLPKEQQNDIAAELSEDIQSQIEERESDLGRALNEDELAALLEKRGRPLIVASRYLPQQYLIGPVLFPMYRFVLKMVAVCYLVPWTLVWIGLMVFDPEYRAAHSTGGAVLGVWGSYWVITLTAFAIVTVIFAFMEKIQTRSGSLGTWDPRRLPRVRDANHIPRANSVFELGAMTLVIAWWVNGMWSPVIFDRSGVRIVLSEKWPAFFLAILIVSTVSVAISAANLVRPYWTRRRIALRVMVDVAGAVIFCWILRVHILSQIVAPKLTPDRAASIVQLINDKMDRAFPLAIAICVVVVFLNDGIRFFRLKDGRAPLVQGLAA
jgi:hypothetical protein